MPFDGSGNFSRSYNWVSDRDSGIKILASRMDAEFNNFASGMNVVFFRSGLVPMSGNLAMGSNYITGLGAGTEASPSIRFTDDVNTGMWLNGAGDLRFSVGSTYRAKITAAGLNVVGLIAATGNATIGGTLAVTGASTLAGLSATTGAFSGLATIGGTLTVTGASTLAGLSATTGAFSGNVTVGGTLGVTGAFTPASIAVTNNATVGGTLAVTGATTLAALSATTGAFSGNTTVGGTFAVTGATTLSGAVTTGLLGFATTTLGGTYGYATCVGGSATRSGYFEFYPPAGDQAYIGFRAVSGPINYVCAFGHAFNSAVTMATTLAVSGAATLNSGIVTNGLTVGTTLGVTGASTLAALSATTGTFSSTLGVTGAATLNSAAVTNALTVGTTLNVTGITTLTQVNATSGVFSNTSTVLGEEIGFRNAPVNAKAAAFSFVNQDRGKHIYYTGAAAAATIDPNATTAIDIGAIIVIVNDGSGVLTLTRGAGVALISGNVDANIAIAVGGMKTILKVGTNRWFTA